MDARNATNALHPVTEWRRGVPVSRTPLPLDWIRGDALVKDDAVSLIGGRIEWFTLEDTEQLLDDFLRAESDRLIIRFVERYGLLLGGPSWDADADYREFRQPGFFITEPLETWRNTQSAIEYVQHLYRLSAYALTGRRFETRRLRSFMCEVLEDVQVAELVRIAEADALEQVDAVESSPILLSLASGLINLILGAHLLRAESTYVLRPAERPPGVELAPASRTLMGHIWLQLAGQLLSRIELRECPECGHLFEVRDPRQIFCSRACGTRERVRRYRERTL